MSDIGRARPATKTRALKSGCPLGRRGRPRAGFISSGGIQRGPRPPRTADVVLRSACQARRRVPNPAGPGAGRRGFAATPPVPASRNQTGGRSLCSSPKDFVHEGLMTKGIRGELSRLVKEAGGAARDRIRRSRARCLWYSGNGRRRGSQSEGCGKLI